MAHKKQVLLHLSPHYYKMKQVSKSYHLAPLNPHAFLHKTLFQSFVRSNSILTFES